MSTETSQTHASTEAHLVIDGISYIPSRVLLSEIPKLSFKDDSAFGMVDHRGEAPRAYAKASAFGFYYRDTVILTGRDDAALTRSKSDR